MYCVGKYLVINGTSPLCRAAITGGGLLVVFLKVCLIAVCLMLRNLRVGNERETQSSLRTDGKAYQSTVVDCA